MHYINIFLLDSWLISIKLGIYYNKFIVYNNSIMRPTSTGNTSTNEGIYRMSNALMFLRTWSETCHTNTYVVRYGNRMYVRMQMYTHIVYVSVYLTLQTRYSTSLLYVCTIRTYVCTYIHTHLHTYMCCITNSLNVTRGICTSCGCYG